MEQAYDQWLSQNAQLIKLASDQNQSSFTQMQCGRWDNSYLSYHRAGVYLAGPNAFYPPRRNGLWRIIQTIADGDSTHEILEAEGR